MGGEIRMKQRVKNILIEGNRAVGVELKNGDQIFADIIISNLDKPATFKGLLADHPLAEQYHERVRAALVSLDLLG